MGMFANDILDGKPVCGLCHEVMEAPGAITRTPTGMWFVHNECAAKYNAAQMELKPEARSHGAAQQIIVEAQDALNEVNKHVNHPLYPEFISAFSEVYRLLDLMHNDVNITARH